MKLNQTTVSCAPVALFVYNRPLHTRLTVEALLNNAESRDTPLVIYSDAPKNVAAVASVAEVRDYLSSVGGFHSLRIVIRDVNFGLARSITAGVAELCREYGRVIVLEDDLITSPDFLRFMNQGLALYENDAIVASIHGYAYPTGLDVHDPESYFLRGADCWGWATWERAWQNFESDGTKLLSTLKSKGFGYRFDYDGNSSYVRMLRNQTLGRNDSWAIRWHASAFLNNMLTLYPRVSLVANIGFDNSGTHCGDADYFATEIGAAPAQLQRIELAENEAMRAKVVKFFRRLKWKRYRNAWRRVIPMLRKYLSHIFGASEK